MTDLQGPVEIEVNGHQAWKCPYCPRYEGIDYGGSDYMATHIQIAHRDERTPA